MSVKLEKPKVQRKKTNKTVLEVEIETDLVPRIEDMFRNRDEFMAHMDNITMRDEDRVDVSGVNFDDVDFTIEDGGGIDLDNPDHVRMFEQFFQDSYSELDQPSGANTAGNQADVQNATGQQAEMDTSISIPPLIDVATPPTIDPQPEPTADPQPDQGNKENIPPTGPATFNVS